MTAKFASLDGGLLVRKGQAVPSLASSAVHNFEAPSLLPRSNGGGVQSEHASTARPALISHAESAPDKEVAAAQSTPTRRRAPATGSAKVNGRRHLRAVTTAAPPKADTDAHYRLTFRMSQDQHRRLRVGAAQKGSSLQQLLSEALDKYLDGLCACSLNDCACMARRDER